MVIKDKTSLSTDLYRKPRDRNTLHRGDSFHPRPLIKSLPISQFSHIRRICRSDASYQKQTTGLTQRFKERGYKDNLVKHANDRFEGLTQLESLQPKFQEKAEHIPLCFTHYSPLGKAFKDIIRKHWYIIETDPQLKPISKNPPHMIFKRPPNVCDIVVKSDYPPEKRETFWDKIPEGNYKCGQCAQCSFTYKCN
uniref:Helix-turn-helix domain-containing protein n=1 Tax=Oncorhynchus tshawytscha TaxID=74940 RepID=A0AAZ3PMQ5_ONCTS